MAEMTERQARAWPDAVAEIQRYVVTSTVSLDIQDYQWTVAWEDEARPGRGQALRAMWCDGEYVAHLLMDVYGYPSVGVAEVSWLHNSSDEECDCAPCEADRDEDEEAGASDG